MEGTQGAAVAPGVPARPNLWALLLQVLLAVLALAAFLGIILTLEPPGFWDGVVDAWSSDGWLSVFVTILLVAVVAQGFILAFLHRYETSEVVYHLRCPACEKAFELDQRTAAGGAFACPHCGQHGSLRKSA